MGHQRHGCLDRRIGDCRRNGIDLNYSGIGSTIFNVSGGTLTVSTPIYNAGANGTAAGLIKTGAGMLNLTGNLYYTGGTTVSGGTLAIGAMGSYNNTTTVASGAVLQWSVPTNVGGMNPVVYNGTGIIAKTGSGYITNANNYFRMNMAAGGVFDVQAGDLNMGGGNNSFGSNLGSLNIAAGTSFHCSNPALQFDALTGSGEINNAYANTVPILTIGVSGDQNNAAYGVVNNTATYSGAIGPV